MGLGLEESKLYERKGSCLSLDLICTTKVMLVKVHLQKLDEG